MGLFRRTKKIEAPEPEVGNANFAKQIKAQSLRLEHPSIKNKKETKSDTKQFVPIKAGEKGESIYEFTSCANAAKRTRNWYIGMAVFFSAIVAINIVIKLYMSAIVTVLLAILVLTTATRKNKKFKVRFLALGLEVMDNFFPWSEFEKFWILYEPPALKKLYLKRRNRVISEVIIELGDENPLKIRDLLLPLLAEDKSKEESKIDLVTRTLKL